MGRLDVGQESRGRLHSPANRFFPADDRVPSQSLVRSRLCSLPDQQPDRLGGHGAHLGSRRRPSRLRGLSHAPRPRFPYPILAFPHPRVSPHLTRHSLLPPPPLPPYHCHPSP